MGGCVCQEEGEAKRPHCGWKTFPYKKGGGSVEVLALCLFLSLLGVHSPSLSLFPSRACVYVPE